MKSLLKVSSRAKLGLKLVSALAVLKDGEVLSLMEAARQASASRKFLEQVAGSLRKSGLIKSQRGATGGYCLNRPAREISIAEVLDAIEGPTGCENCTARRSAASLASDRGIPIIERVQGQVMTTLLNTTLADVVR
jgi:Rrf2 family protein